MALISDSVLNSTQSGYVNSIAKGHYIENVPVFANDLIQVDLQNNYAIGLKSDSTVVLGGLTPQPTNLESLTY